MGLTGPTHYLFGIDANGFWNIREVRLAGVYQTSKDAPTIPETFLNPLVPTTPQICFGHFEPPVLLTALLSKLFM
jgi:hypothetical protein